MASLEQTQLTRKGEQAISRLLRRLRYNKNKVLRRLLTGRIARLPFPPTNVTLLVETKCTNRCIFCCHHSADARHNLPDIYKMRHSMSLLRFKSLVDKIYDSGVPKVHICGTGEPFANKNILGMIDYVIERYGSVSFQTNLNKQLLTPHLEFILERAEWIEYITTDIHSSDPVDFAKIKNGSQYQDILEILSFITDNAKTKIPFNISYIMTKQNYHGIDKLIDDLQARQIEFKLMLNNLHPYEINTFTSKENVYRPEDNEITKELERIREYAIKKQATVKLPEPAKQKADAFCKSFWSRVQIPLPRNDMPEEEAKGNAMLGACAAHVAGNLKSIGNIDDYSTFMEFWNNPKLVDIRNDLINGIYPDQACETCQNFRSGSHTKRQ